SSAAQAPVARLLERMVGAWEMNVAKTQQLVGPAPFKKLTLVYERVPDKLGVLYSRRGIRADGSEFVGKGGEPQFFDGEEYPLVNGNLVVVRTVLNESTLENLLIVKGSPPSLGVYNRTTFVFSSDGRTMTGTRRFFNHEGKEVVADIAVFDKVGQ